MARREKKDRIPKTRVSASVTPTTPPPPPPPATEDLAAASTASPDDFQALTAERKEAAMEPHHSIHVDPRIHVDPLLPLPPTPQCQVQHDSSNPRSYQVDMTDSQLRATLDRFGEEERTNQEGSAVVVSVVGGRDHHHQQPPKSILSHLLVDHHHAPAAIIMSGSNNIVVDVTATRNEQRQQQQHQQQPHNNKMITAGAVACLCSATLGAGILSLPYAMAEAGILCGVSMLLASAVATAFSIQLLVQAMQVVYYSSNSSISSSSNSANNNNNNRNANDSDNNLGQNNLSIIQEQEKTYEDLVEIVLGKPARRVVEASMLFFCCGGAVAYVIAVGDILEQSGWTTFSPDHHSNSHQHQHHRALAMTIVWLVAMVPLSLLRTMKSLECTSSIGIASIATLVLAALYHYVEDHTYPKGSGGGDLLVDSNSPSVVATLWIHLSRSFSSGGDDAGGNSQSILRPTEGILSILRACPIIIFAFSCQVNVCAIYDEMPGRNEQQQQQQQQQQPREGVNLGEERGGAVTIRQHSSDYSDRSDPSSLSKHGRMQLVTWLAVGICALLYTSISIIALLDFGSVKTTPNILSSYDPESIMQVAFVGMALAVVLAYPMNIFPARVTLLGILRSRKKSQSAAVANDANELVEPLLATTSSGDSVDALGVQVSPNSTTIQHQDRELAETSSASITNDSLVEHILATLFLTGLSLALAIVAPNISVVFGLVGGTSSSVLGFIVPGLLGYKTAGDYYQTYASVSDLNDANVKAAVQRTRFFSIMLVVAGILVGVVCTTVTVYSTFT